VNEKDALCPECDGRGEVPATPGQPGDGPMPCRCQSKDAAIPLPTDGPDYHADLAFWKERMRDA
jgi:hypothetical protein